MAHRTAPVRIRRVHRLVPLALTPVVFLAACSQPGPFEPSPMPTNSSAAVTALLPVGPHEMTFTFALSGAAGSTTVDVSGYLDLPESYDLEGACAFDLVATEVHTPMPGEGEATTTSYTFTKENSGPAWRRVDSTDDDYLADAAQQWFAGDDPEGPAPVILLPQLMLDDLAGGEFWCNLRRTDQVARLADPATGRLAWNQAAFQDVIAANMDAWLVAVADAAEMDGSDRDKFLRSSSELATPVFSTMLENAELEVTRTGTALTWTLYKPSEEARKVMITATFTPTQERRVAAVSGALTFAEKLAADDQMRKSFLEGF
jgi:hypothetical protein